MPRAPSLFALFILILSAPRADAAEAKNTLEVGFGERDITPSLKDGTVYMAGFGQNRKATAVHDPLKARAVVLRDGTRKIALVSIDVIGFFQPNVERVRSRLKEFSYILVSSTHNHEGPDTIGIWGPNPFTRGVAPKYLEHIESQIVEAVRSTDRAAGAVSARIGSANAPELLRDGREPYIKHDQLVALQFLDKADKPVGIVVQWNCHPETLDSKNTQLSADFVGYTVEHLRKRYDCPVVYLTGTVGGLMTSLGVEIKNEQGQPLADGTFEKTAEYGRRVGQLAEQALSKSRPLRLTPFTVRQRAVFVPMTNHLYKLARQLGVMQREAYLWTGDASQAQPANADDHKKPLCVRTELAWLRLGDLDVACIPGEIYPELVLDKVQDPPDAGADFPQAPIEPALYKQMTAPERMIIGLANDEIGYIIPKRQWDEKAPFCYGRKKAQYGEINSIGPDTAPILCKAFKEMVQEKK